MSTSDTKTKILDAAEELFARDGFAATSIRAIASRAQVNLASAHYHFGCKEALAREVLGRRVQPLNAARLQRLDRLESEVDRPAVEQIVRAFIEPVFAFQAVQNNSSQMRLFGQIMTGPESIREAVLENFETVATRFVSALSRALPDCAEEDLLCRWRFFVATFSTLMMPTLMIKQHAAILRQHSDRQTVLDNFVAFTSAGLSAPKGEEQ